MLFVCSVLGPIIMALRIFVLVYINSKMIIGYLDNVLTYKVYLTAYLQITTTTYIKTISDTLYIL